MSYVHSSNLKLAGELNWDAAAQDYARYRPGPPTSFYERLLSLGIGEAGQNILDMGTGPGLLAVQFAKQGAQVTAFDTSKAMIEQSVRHAKNEGVNVTWIHGSIGDLQPALSRFDIMTANMCWGYFDKDSVAPWVKRNLASKGRLVVSTFNADREASPLVQKSFALAKSYTPGWEGGVEESAEVPGLDLLFQFGYEELVPFTEETWRGRMRAGRRIGPSLSEADTARFDRQLQEVLAEFSPVSFFIPHYVRVRIYGAS